MQAAIFDFDGLILDTESPEVEAWRSIFMRYGFELPDSWWQHAIGRGHDQQQIHPADLLIETSGRSLDRNTLIAEIREMRIQAVHKLPLMPGVRDRIEEAKSLGLKLGVASSSRHQWIEPLLDMHGIKTSFQALACADDVAHTKPFSDLYDLVCGVLEVHPNKAIAFEDSPPGIHAAKSAGLTAIAIPNPYTKQLDFGEADAQFTSMADFNIRDFIKDFK